MTIDVKYEAKNIIAEHTEAVMCTGKYVPESHEEFYGFMIEECAFLLTEKFLDGQYNPMEYNAIRNEIAQALGDIFFP